MRPTTWLAVAACLTALLPAADARKKKKAKRPKKPAAMAVARTGHLAVTLADGDVLVVGGSSASKKIGQAERYDHVTRRWGPAGTLAEARLGHTATLLADGRVLVSGGVTAFDAEKDDFVYAGDEIWDPATSTFSSASAMVDRRSLHTAVRLDDGRVLAAGGFLTGRGFAEIWDPATAAWTRAGEVAAGSLPAMVALPGGGAAIFGADQGNTVVTFDPTTLDWTEVTQLTELRMGHTATVLPGGKILVAGGMSLSTAEVCDLTAPASCTPTGSLAAPRAHHRAVLLPDGEVAVIGGETGSFGRLTGVFTSTGPVAEVEVWDPTTGAWRTTATLKEARDGHAANLLDDGKILVTGGSDGAPLASVELVTP